MADWIKTIFGIAPTVAAALGGPLAGAAVSAIGGALGMTEPTKEGIAKAFADGQIKPEDLAKIRQLEIEFKTHESDMGFKYAELAAKQDEINAQDRGSARDLLKATGSYVPATLTFGITIGYFVVLLGMMLKQFTIADSQVMLMMLGQLGTAWGVTIAFWFGTTRNSQEKTTLLANSAPVK
ncbi:MAG: hypothetical protein CGW95_17065 [Phenylobacterium zucineum]|nr:MAG: hypothetical protein CGW95_17065 [Phenylobacterium zucineum]